MMKRLLLALVFCFAPRLATAQEVKNPVVMERVTYSRAIPKGLRAWVPRGGKSRFWGATNLKYNGQKVWVHVYDVAKVRYLKNNERGNAPQKSGLDLFIVSPSARLKRVSINRFSYDRFGGYGEGADSETVSVETSWVDWKNRKIPVVRVGFNNLNALYGTITQDVLTVFSQDFKKIVVQFDFGSGSSNGAGWNSWNTSFEVDKRGFLSVLYGEGSMEGNRITTYRWMDKSFKEFARIFRSLDGEEYMPVPLTPD